MSPSLSQANAYLTPAFHFKVVLGATLGGSDTSFQDVSGIASEIQMESVVEGGENRFVHQLPKGVTHPSLVLKRGIGKADSPLVVWCQSVLEADFVARIVPWDVNVFLLDENQAPTRAWSFANAYPVKWDIESFGSTKNEVAIEKIELSYTYSNRLM